MSEENKVITNKMGTENELKILIKMSLPAIFSMLVQSIYNVVDSFFVAQISEKALRAVAMAFPIQLIMIAISVGTCVGVNSYMSRKLGEENHREVGNGAVNGAFVLFLSWLLFIGFRFIFLDSFYGIFTTDPEVASMGRDYLGIVSGFSIFVFYQVLGEKIMQSTGSMVIPMISHMMSSIINMIFDPILIHGYFGLPAMGTKGAAISTVFSQFVGFVFMAQYIYRNREKLGIDFSHIHINKYTISAIYHVGVPAILMTSIAAVLQMGMNWILSSVNEISVTVMVVFLQLQSFVFMPIFGLNQGFLPLIGFNYGAKLKSRMLNLHKYAKYYSLILGIVGFIVFQLFTKNLLMLFGDNSEYLQLGTIAIRILSFTVLFAPLSIVNSNFFQGLGNGKYSFYLSLMRQLIIALPLAYIFSKISLTLVWTSLPIAEFISLIVSFYFVKLIVKEKIERI